MAVFSISSRSTKPELKSRIEEVYPDGQRWQFSDQTWFVVDTSAPTEIAEKLNVKEGGIGGTIIARMSGNYWGRAPSDFWEWLKSSFEGGPHA